MAVDFLTAEQKAQYGQLCGEPNEVQLTRYFYLDEDEARLSPLGYGHINVLGHYSFTLAEQVTKGNLRPLNQPTDND